MEQAQIELLLQNDGVNKSSRFPCDEDEYQSICKGLSLKDNHAYVKAVINPKGLKLIENTFVDLDEVNYLAKRIDSFDKRKTECFFAAIEKDDYLTVQDMINLTFNLDCYTLVVNVSDLRKVGYNHELNRKGCLSSREIKKTDFEKIGRDMILSGKGYPTKYGLLFMNEDIEFCEEYKGKGFPSYYYTGDEVLGVEIKKDRETDYIYFPCKETEIARALKRIGASDISECEKKVDFTPGSAIWYEYFDNLLKKNDIENINAISIAINCLSVSMDRVAENLYKLASVMEFAGVTFEDTKKIILLAEYLDEFGYYRDINDDETLGRALPSDEYCIIPESMDKYMDYARYAQDFLKENGGAFTKNGDVVYLREDQSLSEILGENDIKMGGV